jgi:putative oxidoreductase
MDKILRHPMWTTHALLLARILMGALFVLAGIQKLQGIDSVAGYIASVGLPAAVVLAWLSGIFEIMVGAAIIAGVYFKEAVLALAVFVILAAFIFHNPNTWADQAVQQTMFLKNMAIVAGLLYMAAYGAGNTWKLKLGK